MHYIQENLNIKLVSPVLERLSSYLLFFNITGEISLKK